MRDRSHHHLHRDEIRLLLVAQLLLLRITPISHTYRDATQRLALQRVRARRRHGRAQTHRAGIPAGGVPLSQHGGLRQVGVQLERRAVEAAERVPAKVADSGRLDITAPSLAHLDRDHGVVDQTVVRYHRVLAEQREVDHLELTQSVARTLFVLSMIVSCLRFMSLPLRERKVVMGSYDYG